MMPAVSFSEMSFVDAILEGRKPHTIRPRRKHPIKAGDVLMLYYKQRTQECRGIGITACTKVSPIVIYPKSMLVKLNCHVLSIGQSMKLARADGFNNLAEFYGFFERYGRDTLDDFDLIEWNPKKMIKLWHMHDQGVTPKSMSRDRWQKVLNRRFGGE